jgi:hypothetical protein
MWFSSFSYSEYICDAKKNIVFYFPAVLLLIPNISSSVNWGVPHGLHKIAPDSLSLTAPYYSILLGNMDRFHYRDILNRVMLPYAEWNMPLRFVFQHDNDPKHALLLVREWLQENLIRVMEWPSQSPDLNPIEHLWEEVERRIKCQNKNKNELMEKIQEVWNEIPQITLDKLIDSCQEGAPL